jgi:hypothetical protein
LDRRHGRLEATSAALSVEDGSLPQDRQAIGQRKQPGSEWAMSEPVAHEPSSVPRFKRAVRLVDNQPPHPVDLRLERPSLGLGDRRAEGPQSVVRHEFRQDVEGRCHARDLHRADLYVTQLGISRARLRA